LSGTFNDVSGSGTIPLNYTGNAYTIVIRQSTPYGGFSGSSNSVSVSPNGFLLPPTITSTEVVSTQITVNFIDASSNTGKGVLGYKYSYDEGATYTTLDANATQFVLSNMTLPSYTIWLKTYNALNESSYVETVVTMNTTIVTPTITNVVPGNSQVQVYFTTGDANLSNLAGYKYSTDGVNYIWAKETTSPLTIVGLTGGSSYTITLKCFYINGTSSNTSNVSDTVIPYGIPNPPTITNVITGDGFASVYYTDGSANGSSISTHRYSLNGDDYIDVSYASPIQLTEMINGNPYVIDIVSVNAAGSSVSSNPLAFMQYTIPSKPLIINVIPSSNQATVYIQHGSDNGSDITNYSYSINDGSFVSTSSANTCFTIGGLTNGITYNIKVIAENAAGNSVVSEPYQVIPHGVPNTPTNIVISHITEGMSLTFTDGSTNGAPIDYYLYSLNNGDDIPVKKNTDGTIHIFDLLNETNYSVRLKAVNNAGESDYSIAQTWVTHFDRPLVPVITLITPGNKSAFVHFDEDIIKKTSVEQFYCSINGLPIVPLGVSNVTSPLTVNGLVNNLTYNISIVARNGSDYSNVSNSKSITAGTPNAPVITNVVSCSRSIKVYFDVPFNNGFPILKYLYCVNTNVFTGKLDALTDGSGSYLLIPHLSNGRSYVVYICAINVNGMSLRSNVLPPVIPAEIPDTIKITSITPYRSGTLVVFNPPRNNGEPITKYKYAIGSSTEFLDASGITSPLVIYNTPINSIFSIRLIATNKVGDSEVSAPSKSVKFVYLPPDQIRVTSLRMPTKNSLSVLFSSPALNGSYIVKYKYALNGSSTYIDVSGTSLPLLITDGIVPNVDYNIQVIAVNSAVVNNGESVPSLPLPTPTRFTYLAPVKAPIITTIASGNASATVTFINPQLRGAPIIGYAYSTDADGLVYTDISSVSSPFTITGLTNDTTYNIRIAANTEAGYSPFSVAKQVTPVYKAPSAPVINSILRGNRTLTVFFTVPPANGAPITGYNYTLDGGTKIPVVLNPDGNSFIIMKNVVNWSNVLLTNATGYKVRMTAINEVGESQFSCVKTGVTL
jgi:titin